MKLKPNTKRNPAWARLYKEERTGTYQSPSQTQLDYGAVRRRTDLIREARELGEELLEVWEQ